MWKIRTHRMGIDQGSRVLFSDFKHDGKMWTGDGDREFRAEIAFAEPFLTAPVVDVNLSMWDVDRRTNQRMDICAENITAAGFEMVFRTWGDSRIARVRANWIAIGEVVHDDDWDLTS